MFVTELKFVFMAKLCFSNRILQLYHKNFKCFSVFFIINYHNTGLFKMIHPI